MQVVLSLYGTQIMILKNALFFLYALRLTPYPRIKLVYLTGVYHYVASAKKVRVLQAVL
jgi:hypothetical protein